MEKFNDVLSLITFIEAQKRMTKKVSLARMAYYCSLFDHPENKFLSIHVTGTNGKGSTVQMLKSILQEGGLKVGTFTSPYVTIFNERVQFQNQYISDDDLLKYGNQIIEKYPEIDKSQYGRPSFFEITTLICFLYFRDLADLDIAIIEVGMGGRLDATNVITPILSIITNVSLEHTEVLGNTLEEICFEKLGIVKPGIPLICGIKQLALHSMITTTCKNRHSDVCLTTFTAFEIKEMNLYQTHFVTEGLDVVINLGGYHQIDNAIIALQSMKKLHDFFLSKFEIDFTQNIILSGLKKIYWPGRLEVLSQNPLIITDGCHNVDGIKQICRFLKELDYGYKRAVCAISKDKNIYEMLSLLDESFDEIIFTEYSYKRSADPTFLYNLSKNPLKKEILNVSDAYKYVLSHPVEFTIFLGSLYLVTDIKKICKKN